MLAALALLSSLSLPQQSPPVEWRAVGPFRDRIQPGVVYDERRKRLVLFGGAAYRGGWRPNDMHEWDGKRWHRRRPKHMPVPNRGISGMMAWDPIRKTAIHFGGMALDLKTVLNETWEYDGRDWKKLSPKTVPPKRFTQSMFYDPVRKQILMFGGAKSASRWIGGPGLLNDTWVWDGKDWKQLFPKFKPRPRRGGGLTYWKRTGQMVLYGGVDLANFPVDPKNLYTWDGKNWTQIPLKTSPPPGAGLLVPDPWTGDVLHLDPVGQYDAKLKYRVHHFWRWDGKTFSKFGPAQPKEMTGGGWQPHLFPPTKQIFVTGWCCDGGPGKRAEDRRTTVFDGKSWKIVERRPVVQGDYVNVDYDPIRKGVLVYTLKNLWPTVLNELHWFRPEGYWEKAPMTGLPKGYCYPPGMAFHPKMGKFLLWGGALCRMTRREPVYTYDGKKFEVLKGANPDGPWYSRQLTWDSQHQELLGMTARAPGRLMVFDEKKGWMEKQPSRGDKNWGEDWTMAYDSVRKVAVIYGGITYSSGGIPVRSGELWEFDGKAWKQPTAKVKPPARIRGLLKYVPALGGVVLFGGMSLVGSNEPFMDTWLWDGKAWKQLKTKEHYAGNILTWQGRNGAGTWPKAVAYDSDSQRLIAFHRLGDYAGPEIFEFRVRTLETSQNYPRPGESFWFDVHLPSQAGNPFLFLFSGGPGPSIPLRLNAGGQVERLPLALDNLLMFSLSGATALGLDGSGKGKIPFRIPNDKNLIFFPFYAAGLTFDPKKNAVGRITNRVQLEVSW